MPRFKHAFLVAVCLMFALAACGGSEAPSVASQEPTPTLAPTPTPTPKPVRVVNEIVEVPGAWTIVVNSVRTMDVNEGHFLVINISVGNITDEDQQFQTKSLLELEGTESGEEYEGTMLIADGVERFSPLIDANETNAGDIAYDITESSETAFILIFESDDEFAIIEQWQLSI